MAADKIFVGRREELEQFKKVLEEPQGQAVVVVGQAGMGKTWLINKMAQLAESHPGLKCGWVRYEVTPTDSADSTMALMMDNAFEAAQVGERSLDRTPRRLEQWRAFLNVFNIGDLILSLPRDLKGNTRDQFLKRLELISGRMKKTQRAIFIVDPEKYMQEKSDQSWAIVVRDLPEKIKFVFAQRTEDVLVDSETIDELDNVERIPKKRLGVLEKKAIDKLLKSRAKEAGYTVKQLEKALSRYKGHPYALGAALDLIEAGTKLEELPKKPKPTKFAEVQWKKVCNSRDGAIKLFKAYAILEVAVPDEVVKAVSGLDSDKLQHLFADKYLGGLLREEGYGRRIYHAILADYILGQIGEEEKKEIHSRAVEVYRERLNAEVKPDALAAERLAEHVLAAEGKESFVKVCAFGTWIPLRMLGLCDTAIGLAKRALKMAEKDSEDEAAVLCTLGLAFRIKGDLDAAEKMHLRALAIEQEGQWEVGMAREYGNLGGIYGTRGELDKAEEMHLKSLEIEKKLGRLEGVASQYGNLGLIYEDRGELDKAEEMYKKSLEISEPAGMLELTANQYGNLGVIYKTRGELDKAEEMHKKALEIDERIGLLEGMASDYGNLGLIYERRGELDKAKEMHKKSLEISEPAGMLELTAIQYGNLGVIYQTKGDLDKAEEMYQLVLNIEEKVGRPDSIANAYGNLGVIYEERGDIEKARQYWEKARGLYERIGMPHMVEKMQGWIEGLK